MSTLRKLHILNSSGRNAVIAASSKASGESVVIGKDGKPAEFKRYVAVGQDGLHEDLLKKFGKDDYSEELIHADPEIDIEIVGKIIDATQSLLLDSKGEPMLGSPRPIEVTYNAAGEEIDRREPVEVASTVNDTLPARWIGKKLPKADLVRKYAIKRTMQLRHVDGVTYDFLFAMAEELANEKVVVLLGAGEGGKQPLILQLNGTPYRGFLEGRVSGKDYVLLLHLSNMELKKPVTTSEATNE